MKSLLLSLIIGVATIGGTLAMSGPVEAASMSKEEALKINENDIVVGSMQAKVTVIEYASYTCGHCATFHEKHYDDLKKAYIDTGKVKFIFREMPWDNLALAVSKVARCNGSENASSFVSAFMDNYKQWMNSPNQLNSIRQIARLGGVTAEAFDKCVADDDLQTIVQDIKKVGTDVLGVSGTPTFFINGEKMAGLHTFKQLSKIIDEKLAQ